jgi:hypothetical protein
VGSSPTRPTKKGEVSGVLARRRSCPSCDLLRNCSQWGTELAIADLPPGVRPIFRSAGGLITVGHHAGRLVVLDPEQRRTLADIALKD